MPWDSSGLWLAAVEESEGGVAVMAPDRAAGGEGSSVGQPHWCDDGSLLFVDDRTGWWLPYRLEPASAAGAPRAGTPLVDLEAEFHAPDWVLGQSTLAELGDGSLIARARSQGRDQLLRLRPPARPSGRWQSEVVDQPCVSLSAVAARPDREGPGAVLVIGSSPTEAHGVFEVTLGDGPRGPADLARTGGLHSG